MEKNACGGICRKRQAGKETGKVRKEGREWENLE